MVDVYEPLLFLGLGKGVDSWGRFSAILGGFLDVLLLLPPALKKEEVGVVAVVESDVGWCLISNNTFLRCSLLISSFSLLLVCGAMNVVPALPRFQ